MSNVLPPENQKKILRAQHMRFLLVFAEVAFACALIFYIVLLPSMLTLTYAGITTKDDTGTASSTASATLLKDAKLAVTGVMTVAQATTTPGIILAAILNAKPAGIAIDALAYTAGQPGKIVIGGRSAQPDLVQTFREALDSDARFDSVNIPVSALVASDDGAFTMTLSGAF